MGNDVEVYYLGICLE